MEVDSTLPTSGLRRRASLRPGQSETNGHVGELSYRDASRCSVHDSPSWEGTAGYSLLGQSVADFGFGFGIWEEFVLGSDAQKGEIWGGLVFSSGLDVVRRVVR